MSILFIISGIPASGKTTFAHKLDAKVLSSDAYREKLYGAEEKRFSDDFINLVSDADSFTEKQKNYIGSSVVFALIKSVARGLLENGENVTIDGINGNEWARTQYVRELRPYSDKIISIEMTSSLEECIRRNEARDRKVPVEVIEKYYRSYKSPEKKEGFDELYTGDETEELKKYFIK